MHSPFLIINILLSFAVALSEDMTTNAEYIFYFFRQRGWTTQAICGMLGNMQGDSGIIADFDGPDNTYGLLLWNKTNLIEWASQRGYDYHSIETQCKRIQWEVENDEHFLETKTHPISFRDYTSSYSPPSYLSQIFITNYEQFRNQFRPNRWEWSTNWYDIFTQEQSATDNPLPGGNLYYKIVKGDTLSIIGARYGVTVDELSNWNYIADINKIKAGSNLIIKKGGGHTAKYHTLVPGQYISHLPPIYGIRQTQLCLWNNIQKPNNVYAGQEFRVG